MCSFFLDTLVSCKHLHENYVIIEYIRSAKANLRQDHTLRSTREKKRVRRGTRERAIDRVDGGGNVKAGVGQGFHAYLCLPRFVSASGQRWMLIY